MQCSNIYKKKMSSLPCTCEINYDDDEFWFTFSVDEGD